MNFMLIKKQYVINNNNNNNNDNKKPTPDGSQIRTKIWLPQEHVEKKASMKDLKFLFPHCPVKELKGSRVQPNIQSDHVIYC